jgi:hypothetical protein
VVWSGSERAILLWCAYSGAYLGALISTESELPIDSDQALPAAAEPEDRKHMVDPAKVSVMMTSFCGCHSEAFVICKWPSTCLLCRRGQALL